MTDVAFIWLTLLIPYIILILLFLTGWERLKAYDPQKHTAFSMFSIVIPVRNEQHNILKLLYSLNIQAYDKACFEIIVVDDHSNDSGLQLVQKFRSKYEDLNLKIIQLPADVYSKKEALKTGIASAQGDAVITMDADCIAGVNYLKTVNEYYRRQRPRLLAGPVRVDEKPGLFAKLQALEFSSLIFSAAGSAGISKPLMANGANMIIDRAVFDAWDKDFLRLEYASGDDMFLLDHVRKTYGPQAVHFIRHDEAILTTSPADTLRQFVNQRKRWVSKSKAYRYPWLIMVSLTVLLTALLQLALLAAAFFRPGLIFVVLLLWSIKIIFDTIVLFKVTRFLKQKSTRWWILFLSLCYPFYVIFSAFAGLLSSYEWKGRQHQK